MYLHISGGVGILMCGYASVVAILCASLQRHISMFWSTAFPKCLMFL